MTEPDPSRTVYRIRVAHPETHRCEVEVELSPQGSEVDLAMAAWCPGSYLVRDYARYVSELSAEDSSGRPLSVSKIDKQTWRVSSAGAERVRARYWLYGHDLSVRTNHIDGSHAFLHGPATYLHPVGRRDEEFEVRIELPEGRAWSVETALEAADGGYRASGIDELLDSPLHLGEVRTQVISTAGAEIRLAVWGLPEWAGGRLEQLAGDLESIVSAHQSRFGGFPFGRYLFILMLSPGAYGGLEHKSSSANLFSPLAFEKTEDYQSLLELLSHEFFHAWNGKRIYPAAFAPFDYRAECYTRNLWVVEGITSYLDRYTLRVADKLPVEEYMRRLCVDWARYQATPGRLVHSLEEASFDAWIKLYKPDECNINTTVSYYLKGGLVAMALDLELRTRTDRCLDDVLRHLWERYGRGQVGYGEDVQRDFEEAAGIELSGFFGRLVRGREEIDLQAVLAQVGLSIEGRWESPPPRSGEKPCWLGVMVNSGTQVTAVLDGSPAHRAGISPGDELVAVSGYRVGPSSLRGRIGARAAGETADVAVFRRDQLVQVPVIFEESPPSRYEVVGIADVSGDAAERYRAWMGQPHPGEGAVAGSSRSSWI